MHRRRFIATVSATGAGLSISGCLGDDGGGDGIPDTYRVGANGPSAPVWEFPAFPLFESRLEDEHGSETERTAFMGFTDVVSGVIGDEADICYLSLQALVNARAEGIPIKGFLGNTTEYNFPIVGSDAIDDVEDLEGESIALQDTSAVSMASTVSMIQEELGDRDAAEYTTMPGTEDRLAAIDAGEVDAAAVFTSGAMAAEEDGYASVLGYPWEYEDARNQVTLVWATSEDNIENRPEMLEETAEYLVDAQSDVYEEDIGDLVDGALDTDLYAEFGADVWEESLETARDNELWSQDGTISQDEYDRAMALLDDNELLEDDPDLDDVFTDEFL